MNDYEMTEDEEKRWNNICIILKALYEQSGNIGVVDKVDCVDKFDTELSQLSDELLDNLAKLLEAKDGSSHTTDMP